MVLLQRKHGYRFSKRPYADEFLMQVSQAGFEVIFYSDLPQAMGMETLNKLINVSRVLLPLLFVFPNVLAFVAGLPSGDRYLLRPSRSRAHVLSQRKVCQGRCGCPSHGSRYKPHCSTALRSA